MSAAVLRTVFAPYLKAELATDDEVFLEIGEEDGVLFAHVSRWNEAEDASTTDAREEIARLPPVRRPASLDDAVSIVEARLEVHPIAGEIDETAQVLIEALAFETPFEIAATAARLLVPAAFAAALAKALESLDPAREPAYASELRALARIAAAGDLFDTDLATRPRDLAQLRAAALASLRDRRARIEALLAEPRATAGTEWVPSEFDLPPPGRRGAVPPPIDVPFEEIPIWHLQHVHLRAQMGRPLAEMRTLVQRTLALALDEEEDRRELFPILRAAVIALALSDLSAGELAEKTARAQHATSGIFAHRTQRSRSLSPWAVFAALLGIAVVAPVVLHLAFPPRFEWPAQPVRTRTPPPGPCAGDPPCAAKIFERLSAAERDAADGDAQRLALAIAKSLHERDCASANQMWFIGFQRRGEQALRIDAQRDASRAIEAACPVR